MLFSFEKTKLKKMKVVIFKAPKDAVVVVVVVKSKKKRKENEK